MYYTYHQYKGYYFNHYSAINVVIIIIDAEIIYTLLECNCRSIIDKSVVPNILLHYNF